MKNLLANFDAKVGRQDIFIPTASNESLHEIGIGNEMRFNKFIASKKRPDNSVSIVTRLRAGRHRIFSSIPGRLWNPTSLLSNKFRGFFPRG
jgi:hypothetical protein